MVPQRIHEPVAGLGGQPVAWLGGQWWPGSLSRHPGMGQECRREESPAVKLIIQIPCLNEAEQLPAMLAELPRTVPGFDVV